MIIHSRMSPIAYFIFYRWTAPISFERYAVYQKWILSTAYLYAIVSCLLCFLLSGAVAASGTSGNAIGIGIGIGLDSGSASGGGDTFSGNSSASIVAADGHGSFTGKSMSGFTDLSSTLASSVLATTYSACPIAACLIHDFDPNINYFPIRALSSSSSFSHNLDFSIIYFNSYKIIYNNETSSSPEVYVLYQCGTPKPMTIANNNANNSTVNNATTVYFDASVASLITNSTKYFQVPITNVSIDSSAGSVVTNFLELLGVRDSILFASTTYISSPCIDELAQQGRIHAYSVTNASTTSLVIYGNAAVPNVNNAISIPVTLDATVLARANWIKFLSTFFNREEAAIAIYNSIDNNFQQLSEQILDAATATPTISPIVAWVSSYQSTIYFSSYRNDLVLNAGAIPVNTTTMNTLSYGSSLLNISNFKNALLTVDVLIDESYFSSPPTNYTSVLGNLGFNSTDINTATSPYKFIRNSQVWRYDGRDSYNNAGDDWLETAIAQPDAVLADFVRVTHPNIWSSLSPFAFISPPAHLWFRNVAVNESYLNLPLVCANVSAPSLLLYNYYNTIPSTLPNFTCPAYFTDVTLFGGNKTLSGCQILTSVATGAYNSSIDYFPVKSYNTAASSTWKVQYFKSYKFITNSLENGAVETFILYERGTPKPSLSGSPVQIDASIAAQVNTDTSYFVIPVQTIAVDSSVGSIATSYLELLGVRTSIAFYDATYAVSPCIDLLFSQGVIEYLSYGDAEYYNQISRADLVLEGNSYTSYSNGISLAATSAADSLIGYLNWIKFIALFYNKEATANAIYQQQIANIIALNTSANSYPSKLIVAWVQYNAYTSPPTYLIDQSRYRQDLITNAGGLNLNASITSFTNVSLFHSALLSVDAIIDETYGSISFMDTYTALGFSASDVSSSTYNFFVYQRVYRHDARPQAQGNGGDDYEESAIANADAVLADIIRITQPSVTTSVSMHAPGYLWFRNVAKNENQTLLPSAYTCSDPSAPTLPLLSFEFTSFDTLTDYACPAYLLNPLFGSTMPAPLTNAVSSSSSSSSFSSSSEGTASGIFVSSSTRSTSSAGSSGGANSAADSFHKSSLLLFSITTLSLIALFVC